MKKTLFILITIIIVFIIIIYYLSYLIKNKITITEDQINNKEFIERKVKIFTEDGVEIIGDYYYVPKSKFAGILVHMMPTDRKSLKEMAKILNTNGYSALAIDLRGHGESVNSSKGRLDYRNFSNQEHQNSILDIKAASRFLENEGYSLKNQFLIGASIGANLSLQFLSQNQDIKAAVLISPGRNYRDIEIENFLNKDLENKILVISSKQDSQSFNSLEIFNLKTPSATLIIYEGNLHGTNIFNKYPDLYQKIINFLRDKLIE